MHPQCCNINIVLIVKVTDKMALYFDREMQHAPGHSVANVSYTDVQWHAEHPILAVASKDEQKDADGAVRFYSDEVIQ